MAPAIFWPSFQIWWIKKGPELKKLLEQKINFFMSINYEKEFLNSLHTCVVFSEYFSRASNGCLYSRTWNFQLKISLCSVFQHAEFKFHGCSWIWDFRVCINQQCSLSWLSQRQIAFLGPLEWMNHFGQKSEVVSFQKLI